MPTAKFEIFKTQIAKSTPFLKTFRKNYHHGPEIFGVLLEPSLNTSIS